MIQGKGAFPQLLLLYVLYSRHTRVVFKVRASAKNILVFEVTFPSIIICVGCTTNYKITAKSTVMREQGVVSAIEINNCTHG